MSGSHNHDDIQAAHELKRMAQLYLRRGNLAKADELLELVSRMEYRIKHESKVLEMTDFRDQTSPPSLEEEA
jgi:hypothetical protein